MEDYDIDDYGISEIFDRIEKELTESMMRNFDKHRAEEDEKGINWSQWQVEQLAALEQYKRHNAKKYKREFTDINKKIDGLIRFYRKEGNNAQEVQILEALKKGLNATKSSDAMIGKFFKLNDRKIDALIESLTNDFERCEVAMLRRANDQYRKIIFASQMYATMGGTYEKAVDMASKDFLRAGINNVEYKNGARHNMRDYADMAIRTACKRAYLTGEGEKRKEWGETLVIMNKRGNPCPKCFPWVGLILIDDVWSGGTPDDGPYKLMSTAISEGLYHPRCKDSHSTYFPGITTVDEKTIEDSKRIKEDYEKEQKINYYKRQKEKCERIAKYSLDEDNKRIYQARAEAWEDKCNEKGEFKSGISRIGNNDVDMNYIKSEEFKAKFRNISDNDELNMSIYESAIKLLERNKGTDTEGTYILNAKTGKVILNKQGKKNGLEVSLTIKENQIIKTYKEIVGIHNHPTNLLPNGDDFVAAGYRKYDFGIIVMHNGTIIKYKPGEKPFMPILLNSRIDKYLSREYNMDINEAYMKALNEMRKEYSIEWHEVK